MRCAQTVWLVIALAFAGGCVRACDCGDKHAGQPAPSAGQTGSAAANSALAAGAAATPPSAASGPGRKLDRVAFTPAPDSKLTRLLIAARDEIDKGKVYDKLSEPTDVAVVLGDKLGALSAVGTVSAARREGSGTTIAAAARNYSAGQQTVRVKIIDTAFAPTARRAVSEQLAQIGNEAAGNQRGVFVRGNPAVVAHFAQERASRASALIANRYLVQVMVNEAAQPDVALEVIELLDWGKLAPKSVKVQTKP